MTTSSFRSSDGQGEISYHFYPIPASAPAPAIPATFYCFPGMGDLRDQYRFIGPLLAKRGYRVFAEDLRGHGDSNSPSFTDFSPEAVAADYAALVQSSSQSGNDGRIFFVGNSFAGSGAVVAAANSSSTTTTTASPSGVILLGPVLRPSPSDGMFRILTYLLFNKLWGVASWISYYKTLFVSKPPDFAD